MTSLNGLIRYIFTAGFVFLLLPVAVLANSYQVSQVAVGLGIPWGMSFQSQYYDYYLRSVRLLCR